jgi:hypothetical protein
MYPEFIAMYIGLGVVIVLLIVLIVLAIVILKKIKSAPARPVMAAARPAAPAAPVAGGNVVFCRNCAKQFDSAMRFCPYCGTGR